MTIPSTESRGFTRGEPPAAQPRGDSEIIRPLLSQMAVRATEGSSARYAPDAVATLDRSSAIGGFIDPIVRLMQRSEPIYYYNVKNL